MSPIKPTSIFIPYVTGIKSEISSAGDLEKEGRRILIPLRIKDSQNELV